MGARGPAPKPMALRILEGNPARRPINHDEPKPRPVAPACPAWLESNARREWKRLVPSLERLGLATELDLGCLAGYCQSFARWRAAEELVTKGGILIKTGGDRYTTVKANPAVAVAIQERQLMLSFGSRLGLSPSDRGRMSLPGADDADQDDPFS